MHDTLSTHSHVSWVFLQIYFETPTPSAFKAQIISSQLNYLPHTRLVYKIDKIRIISALKYVFHYLPLKVASEIKIRAFSWAENSENVSGINKIYHRDPESLTQFLLSPCKRYTTKRVG